MGHISRAIDVVKTCARDNIVNFVETGTGDGSSCRHVAGAVKNINIHTIEYVPEILEKTKAVLGPLYANINFHLGSSKDVLAELVPTLRGGTLFWLDAHFPGADYGLASYDSFEDKTIRIPLEVELETICSLRDISKDVFVMDDLRIYEDGPFEEGNWTGRKILGGVGIDFIRKLLEITHNIEKSYSQQGFIIARPK